MNPSRFAQILIQKIFWANWEIRKGSTSFLTQFFTRKDESIPEKGLSHFLQCVLIHYRRAKFNSCHVSGWKYRRLSKKIWICFASDKAHKEIHSKLLFWSQSILLEIHVIFNLEGWNIYTITELVRVHSQVHYRNHVLFKQTLCFNFRLGRFRNEDLVRVFNFSLKLNTERVTLSSITI